jgi:hypothetical protein
VNYGEYVDESPPNPARYDPWRTRNHEFANTGDSAGAPRNRMADQNYSGLLYLV